MRVAPAPFDLAAVRIGTAAWNVPREHASHFPEAGSHLQRYAAVLNAVEINSSFYRPHKRSTYERWAASVPAAFRFAVKIPKAISHEKRLQDSGDLLDGFLSEVAGLGPKLGPLLLQLPPSLPFQPDTARAFLQDLRGRVSGFVVCEPRHPSWFDQDPEALLTELRVARVAADPAPGAGAEQPGGWRGITYRRLRGSPRMYYSAYPRAFLADIAQRLAEDLAAGRGTWCILDNMAAFAAAGDALILRHPLGRAAS
jgi:uncharacterized protein YecE (DUF72 family)